MDILGQSALIAGVTSFGFGVSVLARDIRNKLYLAFAGTTFLVFVWAFSFALFQVLEIGGLYRIHLFCNVWLAPTVLWFIRVWIRIHDKPSARLFDLAVFLALALSGALAFKLDAALWVRTLIHFSPTLIGVQALRLIWIDRRLKKGLRQLPKKPTVGLELSRRAMVYAGGILVLLTSAMDHLPWLGVTIPAMGNIGLSFYLFFLTQAITQQRLLNFGVLLSRFLVLSTLALMLTGLYLIMFAWIENNLAVFFLNSFVISFMLLMVVDPLSSLMRHFTDRLLTLQHRKLTDLLRTAQRDLAGIVDPDTLFQHILFIIDQTLRPKRLSLYVLKGDGTRYWRVRKTVALEASPETPASSGLREILGDHPILEYSQLLRKRGDLPILLDQVIEGEIERSASRTQREKLSAVVHALKALDSNLVIPLFDGGRILAFATLGGAEPPEPWGGNWGILQVLYPYFLQAAQTLRNMEVYARQREKERLAELGEMAAGLAHEIRNPLSAIKGAAQYLDPSQDRPESRFLKVIIEEVDQLNRVVSQFLDYSRPPKEDFEAFDPSVVVHKTVELVRPTLPVGIQIVFNAPERCSQARGSPAQIQQLLLNLIQNSVRALDGRTDGVIRVSIDSPATLDTREIVISVEDNGPGIKREIIGKLFIPFFTTSPSGTGLGLSICQKIAQAHGGRIEVTSEEGRFARFSVILQLFSS